MEYIHDIQHEVENVSSSDGKYKDKLQDILYIEHVYFVDLLIVNGTSTIQDEPRNIEVSGKTTVKYPTK